MADEVLNQLRRAAHADEVHRVEHFLVMRQEQELHVMLLDAGVEAGEQRFMVSVMIDRDGEVITRDANPGATVQHALDAVHWGDFDTHR